MKLSGFHGDLTTNSTNAGNLNTVDAMEMLIVSGTFELCLLEVFLKYQWKSPACLMEAVGPPRE